MAEVAVAATATAATAVAAAVAGGGGRWLSAAGPAAFRGLFVSAAK